MSNVEFVNLHFNNPHPHPMRPMQYLQHTGMWDKISVPYHSIPRLPKLALVYFYNLYFSQPRWNAMALVELVNFHGISNICAIFHITSWNTFPLTSIYHFIFPSCFMSPGNYSTLEGVGYVLLSKHILIKSASHSTCTLSLSAIGVSM